MSTTYTITEALSDKKLIANKVASKQRFINEHLVRAEQLKDPLLKDGGSEIAISRELQAIDDLGQRLVRIVHAIQQSNLITMLTIGTVTQSISDWISWRQTVAIMLQSLQQQMQATILRGRASVAMRTDGLGVTVNLDEAKFARDIENVQTTLDVLDGKLSLLNATTLVTID